MLSRPEHDVSPAARYRHALKTHKATEMALSKADDARDAASRAHSAAQAELWNAEFALLKSAEAAE